MSKGLAVAGVLLLVAGAASAVALSAGPSRSRGTTHVRWLTQRSPLGATLAAPPTWRAARGDRDTLTAVARGAGGTLIGYLNLTPRQGDENSAQWKRFRLGHLSGDGEHDVRAIAYAPNLRLPAGRAACLNDAYTTSTGARYEELACIVEGSRTAVVLGAAPPALWRTQEPVIAQAIAGARP